MGQSVQIPGGSITREAAGDLSDHLYHAMQITSNEQVDCADTSEGDVAIGVLHSKPRGEGEEAETVTRGTSLLRVDGEDVNVAPGDHLGSNFNYHGVKVTNDKDPYFCIALEPSNADNDLTEVLLLGPRYLRVPA